MTSHEILVDPQRLVRVRFLDPTQRTEQLLVALTCSYVPVRSTDGTVRIAVELVADPAMQNPAVPYYCDPLRLQRSLIPPSSLRGITPYQVPA
ncbi:MAG TPA: hypothetical protein VFK02_11285 [Kofleriaceae bacterium]|nr:hypothetical protein [Kofleriaceae bacterium]